MLGLTTDTRHEAKCTATHGLMGHIDPKQLPTKRKPFASLLSHHFVQKVSKLSLKRRPLLRREIQVEMILPEELYEVLKEKLRMHPAYSRVTMPLGALLEGEFFNEYIKKGIFSILIIIGFVLGIEHGD